MKSQSTTKPMLVSAVCIVAFAASNWTASAESLEMQCRAAARAELKGPDCRMWMPPNPASHCNVPTNAEIVLMDSKAVECIRRGGPGRQAKTKT